MDDWESLMRMLKQLLQDMKVDQHQGAGYYTCIPIAKRYNKLLGHARTLFAGQTGIISTFEDIVESDPKDPADKLKVVQGIRIEIGQLLSLLESADEDNT